MGCTKTDSGPDLPAGLLVKPWSRCTWETNSNAFLDFLEFHIIYLNTYCVHTWIPKNVHVLYNGKNMTIKSRSLVLVMWG